jgi:hypothetical protein
VLIIAGEGNSEIKFYRMKKYTALLNLFKVQIVEGYS